MNFVIREGSKDPLHNAWGAELRSLETRIQKGDSESMILRWRSGQWMFQQRKGKQFPKGFLDRVSRHLKIPVHELYARVRFAEKYSSREEVLDAIQKFPSWYQMTHGGLRNPKRAQKAPALPKPVVSLELHRIERLFTKMPPERQTSANIECLRRIHAQLGHLLEAADRMLATIKSKESQHA